MTAKKIIFGHDVRVALKSGADAVANVVRVTLGPRGRNVALSQGFGGPSITNDGVSIAKEITLKDPFENMGAEILKEVANKTNDKAGDGTTTAVVLTSALLNEGLKRTAMGANAVVVRRGIEAAAKDAVAELRSIAKVVTTKEDIRNVASISAESAVLGKTIADTIDKVGKDGVVTVEESQSIGIESDVVEGLEFDNGYISPYMVTNSERMESEIKDASVLVTDEKISRIQDVLPILEKMAQAGKKELVIIADDIDGEALATFVVNKIRGAFTVLAIKVPGYGDRKKEFLADIAVILGTEVVSKDTGAKLEDVAIATLGKASRIVSTKDTTVIVGGKGKKKELEIYLQTLRSQEKNSESKFDAQRLEERIAKLTGGVAIIRVGAATEIEMKYLKDKIEDAVNATKAAIEEGIVPGGGASLLHVAEKLSHNKQAQGSDEFTIGYRILIDSLKAPLTQIVHNSGRDDTPVITKEILKKGGNYGFDASSEDVEPRIVDMFAKGIIDPVKVTRSTVENAASAAAVLLTTEAAIADDPEEKGSAPMMPGGGMPGMM